MDLCYCLKRYEDCLAKNAVKENIKGMKKLCTQYDIPLFFDCCRFAENAYFIKLRETGQHDRSIQEIVHNMFSLCDGMTMSAKKDAFANIGGWLAMYLDGKYYRSCAYWLGA